MVYRPLAEYAPIGNDDRIALIDGDGSIDWCCFPHVAGRSVFARLLDAEDGGHFSLRPTASYVSRMGYVDRTNVLTTTFETAAGRLRVTDFMPITDRDMDPRHQRSIIRHVECVDGSVSLEVEFKPRLDYAREETTLAERERCLIAHPARSETPERSSRFLSFQQAGPLDMDAREERAVGYGVLEAGDTAWFAVQSNFFTPMPPTKCRQFEAATTAYWQDWATPVAETVADIAGDEPWTDELVRSGLVLKLVINEATGGIYAAATTSLPEEYGGERNWDYRYNWIRDAKFTVQALYNLGEDAEAQAYFEWFREISHEQPEDIQPVYGVHGERNLREQSLDHLAGYRHSAPVRVGNAAAEQRQLDVYGTIIQGLYETLLHDEEIDREDWESIRALVEHVCSVWEEPGAGIWEFREDERQYVHSKLLCWVALDRGLEIAGHIDETGDLDHWETEREEIREAIETRGFSESANSFVQHFETDETLDATCLLIPLFEFLPADDSRVERTIDTLLEELLTEDGLVHRTKGADVPGEGRGAFLFCTFWLVDALVLAGREERAREIFSDVLKYVDSPYLLPERIDPSTGEYFGNFPQAFSHIGLVNSAVYLNAASDGSDLEHDPLSIEGPETLFRTTSPE